MSEKRLHYRNSYTVPHWCRLPIVDHFDGMGGCWGVSSGHVEAQGRDYCRTCSFYRKLAERFGDDGWGAAHDLMDGEARHRGKFVHG